MLGIGNNFMDFAKLYPTELAKQQNPYYKGNTGAYDNAFQRAVDQDFINYQRSLQAGGGNGQISVQIQPMVNEKMYYMRNLEAFPQSQNIYYQEDQQHFAHIDRVVDHYNNQHKIPMMSTGSNQVINQLSQQPTSDVTHQMENLTV